MVSFVQGNTNNCSPDGCSYVRGTIDLRSLDGGSFIPDSFEHCSTNGSSFKQGSVDHRSPDGGGFIQCSTDHCSPDGDHLIPGGIDHRSPDGGSFIQGGILYRFPKTRTVLATFPTMDVAVKSCMSCIKLTLG